jgi:hypothetical protein
MVGNVSGPVQTKYTASVVRRLPFEQYSYVSVQIPGVAPDSGPVKWQSGPVHPASASLKLRPYRGRPMMTCFAGTPALVIMDNATEGCSCTLILIEIA